MQQFIGAQLSLQSSESMTSILMMLLYSFGYLNYLWFRAAFLLNKVTFHLRVCLINALKLFIQIEIVNKEFVDRRIWGSGDVDLTILIVSLPQSWYNLYPMKYDSLFFVIFPLFKPYLQHHVQSLKKPSPNGTLSTIIFSAGNYVSLMKIFFHEMISVYWLLLRGNHY